MKKNIIIYLFIKHFFIQGSVKKEYSFECDTCKGSIAEKNAYIKQLESTVRSLYKDIADLTKKYSDEVGNKAAFLERQISESFKHTVKIIDLEHRYAGICSNIKKNQLCN